MDQLIADIEEAFRATKDRVPGSSIDRHLPPDVLQKLNAKINSLLSEYQSGHTDWQRCTSHLTFGC